MKIDGTSGMNVPAGAIGMDAGLGGQTDPMVRDLQRQIEDLQNRMKEISANPDLTMEMKAKKRQEIQKQISDLEMQLRQRQMEVKREEAMKRSSKDYQADETFGTKQSKGGKAGKNGAGLSASSMEAMISADTSMKQADVHGSVARTMEGKAGVLEAEIKQDSAMGAAPAGKEEALAEARAMADEATSAQMGALAQAAKDAKKANEADQSQDTGKSDKEQNGVKTDEEKEKDGTVAEKSDESKDPTGSSTYDVEQLGVPFSRGYQPVDVKL
ncbi:MAG: FlxA-like family protein [Lachnospiraceae bacterium]|nr:FlxA-like family protein [Lachnospiraceae bacterium]